MLTYSINKPNFLILHTRGGRGDLNIKGITTGMIQARIIAVGLEIHKDSVIKTHDIKFTAIK